jgi:hypothetical protein
MNFMVASLLSGNPPEVKRIIISAGGLIDVEFDENAIYKGGGI